MTPSPSTFPPPRVLREDGYTGEINAAYHTPGFHSWLRNLPREVASADAELIYRVRNRVYRVPAPAGLPAPSLCVKSFAKPSTFQSYAYSASTAGTKAAKSFRYSVHLRQHGVGVPDPVCFYERWEGRHLAESHFVTAFLPDTVSFNTEFVRLLREDPDCETFLNLLRLIAGAIRRMHDCGFVHNDLAGQNILLRKNDLGEWGPPLFIDLNRGKILPAVSLHARARELARLELPSFFRRIFFHIYFGDAPIPRSFARWERFHRSRITFHHASRRYRHPIRQIRDRKRDVAISAVRPPYENMWLWDRKSGQPAIMLEKQDRSKHYARSDLWSLLWHNLLRLPAVWRQYRLLRTHAYAKPVTMRNRIGVCADVSDGDAAANLRLLESLPGCSVFLRCYFHHGEAGIGICRDAAHRLKAAGHEVALGLIQSRQSVLDPAAWTEFCDRAVDALHADVSYVEIGHAVNRVKWGTWTFKEIAALYACADGLRARHPGITLLGPAVNDFEYHYYAPLLARMRGRIDGLSCHLYVDRRGEPENPQGPFSLLEKCALGLAIARAGGLQRGFHVTETNWPLRGVGEYSPIQCPYRLPDEPDSHLAVSELTCAAYLVRYYLIALCSGYCERVWWWNLTARGFGLTDETEGFRERPSWHAFLFMQRTLGADTFRLYENRDGAEWFHFDRCSVAYARDPVVVAPPDGRTVVCDLYGQPQAAASTITLSSQPIYLFPPD